MQARLCQQQCPELGTQEREPRQRCAACQPLQVIRGCRRKMLGLMVLETRNMSLTQLFRCPFVPRDVTLQIRSRRRGALVLEFTSGWPTHWQNSGAAAGRYFGHKKALV